MTALVTQLGPLGVFLLMVPESACIPVPSELTLMCAGFGVRQGLMPLWIAVIAATAGNLLGSLIAYGIGRAGAGRRRKGRAGVAFGRIDGLFSGHGSSAVFLARLMPLARTFVSLPAGYARVAVGPFVAMTVVGSALWALAFIVLGALAGSGWSRLGGTIGDLLLAATAIAGLLIAVVRKQRSRAAGSK